MNDRINYSGFVGARSEADEQGESQTEIKLRPLDFRGSIDQNGNSEFDPAAAVQALRRIAAGKN
jgi:hypothetical protein